MMNWHLSRYRKRPKLPLPPPRQPMRKGVADHTRRDVAIMAHLPPWLRADYKVADRIAADRIFDELSR